MAKLSDLIETFASALSVPQTTVETYVKTLRKQGLLTTGGRGRGAPDVTADDCAKVMVAMMAGSPTHAVEKLSEIGNFRSIDDPNKIGEASSCILDALELSLGHTLLEGVTALIAHSIEKPPAIIAQDTVRTIFSPPEGSIHEFGAGNILINHQAKTANITFSLLYSEHITGNSYRPNRQDAWISYMPEEYWISRKMHFPHMKTEVSINLHAVDLIGAMLGR
ncbi:MAG: hypothetical protein OJK14_02915 [Achromobacter sp.]|uniref:hypothetical protein n=1 Tax=Achromobacter sp. TaxID=134375 RepID=UPI002584C8D2|nr:hypothetical protein [Achromobacter sp.]MCW0206020.1 hypothetical protein [Achromobacter sp.]